MQKKEPINIKSEFPNLKFFFVKNLRLFANAICLFWIDEIHIDQKLKDSPILEDIIRHELNHYRLVKEILELRNEKSLKSVFKIIVFIFYNNLWDLYDGFRIELKYYILKFKKFIQQ